MSFLVDHYIVQVTNRKRPYLVDLIKMGQFQNHLSLRFSYKYVFILSFPTVYCHPIIPKKLMCAASGLAHNHVVFVHLLIFLFYPLIGKLIIAYFNYQIKWLSEFVMLIWWLFYQMKNPYSIFFPGPWYIGRLAGDKYGVVFMWGIFVDSSALPGELTYPDAFFLVRYPIYFAYYVDMLSLSVGKLRSYYLIC